MKKRLLSILAAVLLMTSLSSTALASGYVYNNTHSATNSGIPRASLYLSAQKAWCTAVSGGKIEINFQVTATSRMNSVGATSIYVYEKSGARWIEAAHFTSGTTSGMLESNTSFCSSTVTFKGTAGVQYKAIVTAYAGNSSTASDSIDVETAAVTAIR